MYVGKMQRHRSVCGDLLGFIQLGERLVEPNVATKRVKHRGRNKMVGCESQSTIQMFGRQSPSLFNLAQPLQLVDSATTPGVQLADAFASATVYAIKNPTSEIAATWRAMAPNLLSEESIVSDLSHFDLTQPRAKANAVVVHGLIDRSLRGQLNIQELPSILSQIDRQFGL